MKNYYNVMRIIDKPALSQLAITEFEYSGMLSFAQGKNEK